MATFLICHGAWGGGRAWRKVRPLLAQAGHNIFTPTYTGLGERAHLAHPLVDLETHIQDVLGVIECEDLRDIVLVGHSYGGMVATGVADRVPERLAQLVYLDAFVPQNGQSLSDLTGGGGPELVAGWLLAPMDAAPDTALADLEFGRTRRHHQPVRCFIQKLHLIHAAPSCPRTYIHCTKKGEHDSFRQFADRFATDPAWRFLRMDASHSPNTTAPDALAALLLSIV